MCLSWNGSRGLILRGCMNNEFIQTVKKNIVAIGRLLWEKDLATALNGNISARVDDEHFLLTASKTCLGLLNESDVLLTRLDGKVLDPGTISTERLVHTEIYKEFPHIKAVLHSHTTFTNAYFLEQDCLQPRVLESRISLGQVKAVAQQTPSVTDAQPIVAALKDNNVVVLKNHGVVAIGEDLFDCFLLIQSLEEATKVECFSRLFRTGPGQRACPEQDCRRAGPGAGTPDRLQKRYIMFSREHIDEIVKAVNADDLLKSLGEKTDMTMELAVLLNETGQVYSFQFERGRITDVGHNRDAEFLISAPEKVWSAVFLRQIDPFVATTQKKMHLKGDFARISKWYAPCNRIFELWQQVPIEG